MPSEIRFVAAGAAFVGGSAAQLLQASLWPEGAYATLLATGLLAAAFCGPRPGRAAWLALLLGCALIGGGATGWRASVRLADALPVALEARDLPVTGRIVDLPQRTELGWRFRFEPEAAASQGLPARLALSWYREADGSMPALEAGQRWQLTLRLKRPHGAMNPHGFDHELWLFEQGVRATGYVRSGGGASPRLLATREGEAVARARQHVREAIAQRLPEAPAVAGVLAALAIGDQSAIDRDDWALYRDTGVGHLVSISGVHVTMLAWLAAQGIAWGWRRSARLSLACPSVQAARVGGLLVAVGYAVMAGWGVPAQRTVLMLGTATLVGLMGLRWPWPLLWTAAAAVVAAADPWALLQPGFWLSFVAVGLLMASGQAPGAVAAASGARSLPLAGPAWQHRAAALPEGLHGALRTQLIATLGLAPLTLVFFQQLSLVGFVANLFAIPLVTLAITPLALLGIAVPWAWEPAAALVTALNEALAGLAAWQGALWSVPAAPAWAVVAAMAGAALALLPLPWRVRALAAPLLLPLLMPPVALPAPGRFELLAADVGQGTAVLVRTAHHALLYDAGPQYSAQSDAGERVLLPLLRALGVHRLDALVLSHRDTDHVGGAAAVLRTVPIDRLTSSLEAAHPLRAQAVARRVAVAPCLAGDRWTWDGVQFEWLHPQADDLARAELAKAKPNALSCVLRIRGTAGSALLAGDIERAQEARLVASVGEGLRAEVLLLAHHGSKTSSSPAFLDAVQPRVAVIQAGYLNRFGHPAPEVTARLAERGIEAVESPRCGAWWLDGEGHARCWRDVARRYWHHADTQRADNGLEVAIR